MTEREKVIKGLECCIVRKHPCGDCVYFVANPNDEDTGWRDRDKIMRNAIELLKAQGEVIDALLKVGYPHNFQREPRWIVNYMYAITDVIKKAVNLRNEVSTIPEEKV